MKQYWFEKFLAVVLLLIGALCFGSEFGANVGFGVFFIGMGFFNIISREDT